MIRFLLSFILFVFSLHLTGQTKFIESKEKYIIPKDLDWIPDVIGNILFFNENNLYKAQNSQLPNFSQSIRATGEITQLIPINAFKTILFSQDQQQICVLDNTFSINGECIDLEDYNIQNATHCAVSSRSNMLYVYDTFNSTLYLIDLLQKLVIQSVLNVNALVAIELKLKSCREHNNDFYLLTENNTVYVFDMFLNLKGQLEQPYTNLNFWQDYILTQKEDTIHFNSLKNKEMNYSIAAPFAETFKVEGNSFYFSNQGVITTYELKSE